MIKLEEIGDEVQEHNRRCSGVLWYYYDPVELSYSDVYCDEINRLHSCNHEKASIETSDTNLIKKISKIKKERFSDQEFRPIPHPNVDSWQGALVKELQKEQSFNIKRDNLLEQLDKLWNDVATDGVSDAYVLMKVKKIRDELATLQIELPIG